jgi:hypothetical protein
MFSNCEMFIDSNWSSLGEQMQRKLSFLPVPDNGSSVLEIPSLLRIGKVKVKLFLVLTH